LNNTINLAPSLHTLCRVIGLPTNGDCIVTIDSVMLLHSVHYCVRRDQYSACAIGCVCNVESMQGTARLTRSQSMWAILELLRQTQGSHRPLPVLPHGGTLSTRHFHVAMYAGTLMCKHDVANVQHAHCDLVGSDCKKLSRASAARNGYSYAPSLRLRACEPHCLSLAATSGSQLAYVQI